MIRRHSTITALASVALALGIAASTAAAAAPSHAVPRAELQRALDGVVAAGVPGAIVLVRDGNQRIRLASGYGYVAKKTPIRTTDRFRIGSLTKTFVSTVVLQLVDEGKVSLGDSVERWLPGLVPNGRKISVHQLLNMTSGLFDYLDDRDKTVANRVQAGDVTYRYSPRELVRIATAHKPNFAPGKGWSYCNTCYVLLGLVVEKATGRSIGTELRRRILTPLHLSHTTFDTEPQIAGRHSHGYYPLGKRLVDISVLSPSLAWAAGGMVSTADDLERFYSALNRGRLLPANLLRAMRDVVPSSGYGLGLAQAKAPCGTFWGNGGDFPGYNANAYGSADGSRQYVLFLNLDEAAFTPRVNRALERVALIASCGGRAS